MIAGYIQAQGGETDTALSETEIDDIAEIL